MLPSYSEGGRHGMVAQVRCISAMVRRYGGAWSWVEEDEKQDVQLYFVHDSRHTHRPDPTAAACHRTRAARRPPHPGWTAR